MTEKFRGIEKLDDGRVMIFNGGNHLPGCPESWDAATAWEDAANGDIEEWEAPRWRFDCGFKLDFDGPLLRVSSRFYPPKTHYGATWDGDVEVLIGERVLRRRKFDEPTLDALKSAVEAFVDSVRAEVEAAFGLDAGEGE